MATEWRYIRINVTKFNKTNNFKYLVKYENVLRYKQGSDKTILIPVLRPQIYTNLLNRISKFDMTTYQIWVTRSFPFNFNSSSSTVTAVTFYRLITLSTRDGACSRGEAVPTDYGMTGANFNRPATSSTKVLNVEPDILWISALLITAPYVQDKFSTKFFN